MNVLTVSWIDCFNNGHEEKVLVTCSETSTRYVVCYDLNELQNVVYDVNVSFALVLNRDNLDNYYNDDENALISSEFYILRDFILIVFQKTN